MKSLLDNIGILGRDCPIETFDIFTYLNSLEGYSKKDIREISRMEGPSLTKDGYVLDLKFGKYTQAQNPSWYAVLGKVKPREREKDPVSGLKFYWAWIILCSDDECRIFSASCWCKGG